MMIASKSCARKGGKERGSMEESERMRRGMLTMGERCNPVSNMLRRHDKSPRHIFIFFILLLTLYS